MPFCRLFYSPSGLRSADPCGECGARLGAEVVAGDVPQLADLWNGLPPSQGPARLHGLEGLSATSSRWLLRLSRPARALPLPVLGPGLQARILPDTGSDEGAGLQGLPILSPLWGLWFPLFLSPAVPPREEEKGGGPFPKPVPESTCSPLWPNLQARRGVGEGFCEPSEASVIRWEALKTNPRCYVMMGGHTMSSGFCHLGMRMVSLWG